LILLAFEDFQVKLQELQDLMVMDLFHVMVL